jgi:transposase
MSKCTTWVALDTSKKKHAVATLTPYSKRVREWWVPNEARGIRRLARKLIREAPGEVRVCYEAGPCGYALKRLLEAAAPGLVCEVIAPSLIPVRPGKRIKTDRRDARDLLYLYRAGLLTVVHPPTEADEGVRDLVRCRQDAKRDLLRARHRLSKYLLRRGRVYVGRAWTGRHEQWLRQQVWEREVEEEVFEDYRLAIAQIQERIKGLDARIEAISQEDPYQEPVGWLRCYRGIDTITAMTILTEIHDFRRFKSAGKFMSYLGLVVSENTSADRIHRGSITKTGNSHVRRVLVEAAWHSRHRPAVGKELRKRRKGQPAWVIAHADQAMIRLHKRYKRLIHAGKPGNKVTTAIARELAGFIWAVLDDGYARQTLREQRAMSRSEDPSKPSLEAA